MTAEWEVPGPPGTRFSSIRHLASTGSTNADLLTVATQGGAAGAVLVADHQSAGRGRQSRQWHDQAGNSVLMSILLRPSNDWASLTPLLAGLAVADAVDALTGLEAMGSLVALKWPNDVLAPGRDDRKLAGILSEATVQDGALAVVVGIGLNVRWSEAPNEEVAARGVTLEDLAGVAMDRWDVVHALLQALESRLLAAENGGPTAILEHYRRRCITIGRSVRFQTPTTVVEGRAIAVADNGGLVVETDDGPVTLTAGDAHHV